MTATPQSIGRYVVRERLGQGGMGVLYLALDPAIDRLVAVKLLGVQGPELRERFVREAGLAGRLQHPNIVTVYDVGAHEGQPFIAMEYIPGETLGELIQRRATLSLRRRLELIVEGCQGLAFAHRHGIIHRDVKPANLMVSRDSGALKVLDFGIARGMDSSLTQAGMVMGTPNYMSPEQLEGRPLDHRSDVFALGLVLYEVLGYRQAFTGDTPQAVWHQIISAHPASILEVNPNLDEGLARIIDRAIAKRVEDRYPDLDALRADLLRVIHKLTSMQSGDTLVDALPITPPSAARRPDFARLAERRAAQIAIHLRNAEQALAAQNLEHAQEAAEEAALLDTNDPRVLTLLERIRQALDAREVSGLVADAQEAIRAGSLTSAAGLISRVLQMMPTHADALALRATLQQAIETREREQERARAVTRALEQAEAQFEAGSLEAALRTTSEALGYDPSNAAALDLRGRLQEAVRLRIDDALTEARADAAAKRYTAALRRLEQVRPRDERIMALESELREARAAAQEAAAREAAAREAAAREAAAQEAAAQAAALEAAALEAAAREAEAREAAAREAAAQEAAAQEAAAQEAAAQEAAAQEAAAQEAAAQEAAAQEAAAQEAAAREAAASAPAPTSDRLHTSPPMPAAAPPLEPIVVGSGTPADAVTAWRPPPTPTPLPADEDTAEAASVSIAASVQTPPPVPTASPATPSRLSASRATPAATATPTPSGQRPRPTTTGAHAMMSRAAAATRPEQRRAQAQNYLDRARTQLAVGDFARSLSLVDAALALDPQRAEANELRRHIDQAWAANELGRPTRSRGAGV
jgi:tetratricopeptide (TPR) repeat protein/predicted Ser/Thr protein kinase